MARSYQKTPITGNSTCHSEKHDKRIANRRRRCAERSYGRTVRLREVSDTWWMGKDGKRYLGWDFGKYRAYPTKPWKLFGK